MVPWVGSAILLLLWWWGKTQGESYLEGELVHWVDLAQVIHYKVEQRCPGCCWPIVLSGLIDFHFSWFGFLDLETQIAVHGSNQSGLQGNSLGLPCEEIPVCIQSAVNWGRGFKWIDAQKSLWYSLVEPKCKRLHTPSFPWQWRYQLRVTSLSWEVWKTPSPMSNGMISWKTKKCISL